MKKGQAMGNLAFRKFYKDIDSLEIKPLEAHAVNIEKLQDSMRRVTVRKVLEIGKELIEARQRLGNKGTGKFGAWCRDRLKMARRTAYNYIYSYEVFGGCAIVAQSFDVTAMYLLAQPGVKSTAVTEALIHAENGRRITLAVAKQILDLVHQDWQQEERKYQKRYDSKDKKKKSKRDDQKHEDGEIDESGEEFQPDSRQLTRLKKAYNETSVDDRKRFKKWVEERTQKYEHKRHSEQKRLVECGDKGVMLIKRKGEFQPKYDKDGRRLDRKTRSKRAG
jgi:hypothetical protein